MPPKRKREETQAATNTSNRTTRSTRATAVSGAVNKLVEAEPAPAKKVKTTKAPSKTKTGSTKAKGQTYDDARTFRTMSDDDEIQEIPKLAAVANSGEIFKANSITKLFTHFASASSPTPGNVVPDHIGPEGFELLCNEANLPLSGALPLILAWQLGTREMGKITKEEWVNGLNELRISSVSVLALALHDLENLLLLDKLPLSSSEMGVISSSNGRKRATAIANGKGGGKTADELYNRGRYFMYASDKKQAFGELYQFCFALAKPPQGRNIEMETAIAFWSVLLTPQYPIVGEIIDFLTEKGTYRGANKDIWNMVLEFCRTVDPNLDGYEMDAAWPTVLDDFVSWKKQKGGSENGMAIDPQ